MAQGLRYFLINLFHIHQGCELPLMFIELC